MERSAEESSAAALLASALSLGLPADLPVLDPGLGPGPGSVLGPVLAELCRLRRRRRRELLEREKRRRQYLRRRRAFVLSSVAAALSLLSSTSRPVWVRDRAGGQNLWTSAGAFDDDEWKAQFRVSRATFDFLLELLGPAIERRKTNYRVPIEPGRRLAIALWWLARSGEYRSIADLFGVGIATVCNIVRQVCSAIVERLFGRYVSLPSGARLDAALRAFRARCYPQCAGAIGGTHVPIAPPRENPEHYMNRSGWHSVILQAVVDHDVCFADVYAGWPGSSSSATVLCSSDLYLKAEDGYLFPRERSVVSEGVEVPVHLVGDASFPLKPWLMKGFGRRRSLSAEQRRFSLALSSSRSVVDAAFARLTGRWRCLLRRSELDVSTVPRVVAACCVLHNICESRGDRFLPEWTAEAGTHLRQPEPELEPEDAYGAGQLIRDTMTYNLLSILQDTDR